MTDTTRKTETASIKSIMAGGVWRSRRVVAALAITAGLSFGVVGATVPQADAGVGWCYRCTGVAPQVEAGVGWCYRCTGHAPATLDSVGKAGVYTVRPNVYASAY